jgi:hypothetical protein
MTAEVIRFGQHSLDRGPDGAEVHATTGVGNSAISLSVDTYGRMMNAEWARLFQELTHGLNANIVVWEVGHPFWRGETELQTVLLTLLGK